MATWYRQHSRKYPILAPPVHALSTVEMYQKLEGTKKPRSKKLRFDPGRTLRKTGRVVFTACVCVRGTFGSERCVCRRETGALSFLPKTEFDTLRSNSVCTEWTCCFSSFLTFAWSCFDILPYFFCCSRRCGVLWKECHAYNRCKGLFTAKSYKAYRTASADDPSYQNQIEKAEGKMRLHSKAINCSGIK